MCFFPSRIILIIALATAVSCGLPFQMPYESQSYRLLREAERVQHSSVEGFIFSGPEDYSPLLQTWTYPDRKTVLYSFAMGDWYDKPHALFFADFPDSPPSDSDALVLKTSWSAFPLSTRNEALRFSSRVEDTEYWGTGITPMHNSTGSGALRISLSDTDFRLMDFLWLRPWREDSDAGTDHASSPYWGYQDIGGKTAPQLQSEFASISDTNPEAASIVGSDSSHSDDGSLYILFHSETTGNLYEVGYSFDVDFSVDDGGQSLSDADPVLRRHLPVFDIGHYLQRGWYFTSAERSWISLFNTDDRAFHTFAWNLDDDSSLVPLEDRQGKRLEGRLQAVLHDGTLLLIDDHSGHWILYAEAESAGDNVRLERFHPGTVHFRREFVQADGTYVLDLSFPNQQRSGDDARDVSNSEYHLPTQGLYELAGFTPPQQ